ncbi:hypothetical protein L798_09197 [Zootermopsis nevadensis]|uniref:Uncharacterized protein n=1 Tax=Zootermopsis nevadensis TaxID=136037 RepID=A0A067RST6_ZOONE|nr:hypothetical protein L798_09197 [Zootermopsis nevadensis]
MQRQRKKFEDARELRLLSHYLIPGDVMTTADSATLSSKRLILNPDSQINRFQEHLHLETRRDTLLAPNYKHLSYKKMPQDFTKPSEHVVRGRLGLVASNNFGRLST